MGKNNQARAGGEEAGGMKKGNAYKRSKAGRK